MRLIPKNWSEFQQYKDRKPQWIKFHRDLLNDFAYSSVHINTKATLPLLWLLACEYDDGIIDASIDEIAFRIHIDKKIVKSAIDELLEIKFFSTDDSCTEVYKTVPREEKRRDRDREETETENNNVVSIVEYLNLKAGTKYKHDSAKTKSLIKARLNEGFDTQDFYVVIDKKVMLWGNDPKMQTYLRPETLFGTKFESYLNEVVSKGKMMEAQGIISSKTAKGFNVLEEWGKEDA